MSELLAYYTALLAMDDPLTSTISLAMDDPLDSLYNVPYILLCMLEDEEASSSEEGKEKTKRVKGKSLRVKKAKAAVKTRKFIKKTLRQLDTILEIEKIKTEAQATSVELQIMMQDCPGSTERRRQYFELEQELVELDDKIAKLNMSLAKKRLMRK
ncbi:unnamed protein product [Mucor hiemalis]